MVVAVGRAAEAEDGATDTAALASLGAPVVLALTTTTGRVVSTQRNISRILPYYR